jgi:hypothetical protein
VKPCAIGTALLACAVVGAFAAPPQRSPASARAVATSAPRSSARAVVRSFVSTRSPIGGAIAYVSPPPTDRECAGASGCVGSPKASSDRASVGAATIPTGGVGSIGFAGASSAGTWARDCRFVGNGCRDLQSRNPPLAPATARMSRYRLLGGGWKGSPPGDRLFGLPGREEVE